MSTRKVKPSDFNPILLTGYIGDQFEGDNAFKIVQRLLEFCVLI